MLALIPMHRLAGFRHTKNVYYCTPCRRMCVINHAKPSIARFWCMALIRPHAPHLHKHKVHIAVREMGKRCHAVRRILTLARHDLMFTSERRSECYKLAYTDEYVALMYCMYIRFLLRHLQGIRDEKEEGGRGYCVHSCASGRL